MQSLRSRSAVAFLAAVVGGVGGVLGNVPTAGAEPVPPQQQQQAQKPQTPPTVWPRPQSLRTTGGGAARVTPAVTLVAAPEADPYALGVIRDVLRAAGARTIHESTSDTGDTTGTGLTVYADGPAAEAQLSRLKAQPRADLPAGGYRLAVDGDTVALAGVGDDGLFHAAQTLRRLLGSPNGTAFTAAVIRDWPTAKVRGTAESFYGVPWTQAQRLSQLDFMGRTKQNRLLYAPGDDPYRQAAKWREPYPAAQRAEFRALADRAAANHVTLAWAVAPGQGFCFSSAADLTALTRKVDAMWALGFRAFQLQFQDVSYTEWHCGADAKEFGRGPEAAARAQARVTNALADHLAGRPGASAAELSLMPTEYYQDGPTKYRTALATALRPGIAVAWTGVGVLPERITGGQLASTEAAFKHPLLTVDNYPVNDYAPTRLFLGPYTGREPAVASASAGVVAAAMQQPAASRIALFTAADYAWNARGYDAQASWQAAMDDLAGPDQGAREALRALAGHDASSALGGTESAYLRPLLTEFWTAYESADRKGLPEAARRLRAAFTTMRWAPGRLAGLADGSLGGEVRPWLDRLALYGTAGERAVDMLLAQARGDGAAGWQGRLAVQRARTGLGAGTAKVGGGDVLDAFLTTATTTADSWTGVHADRRKATVTQGSARATDPSLMIDGKDGTAWSSDLPPQEGDAFGVDLGLVRPVGEVRIAMGSAADSVDYLHDAVLEYSAGDDAGWQSAGTFHDRRTVAVRLPAGARARFVRLRATGAQPSSVAVRAFDVPVDGTAAQVAGGDPAARAVTDHDVTTSYQPGGPDGPLTVEFGAARPLEAVTVLTEPGGTAPATGAPAAVEVRVPGKGWQRVGALADGWTELPAHGVTADAIRLTPTGPGSGTAAVHEIVPWFTEPPRITLDSAEADAEIGGGPVTVRAELRSGRPQDARGTLEAAVPKGGVRAEAPGTVVVRRGAAPVVPVRVSVPAGSAPGAYSIPVRFTVAGCSAEQWITVRARPRTGGPDLVRGARATSSGDETPDFPASAIADGDPGTRWSSPVEDDAWVQVELTAPARVGRVVLHWQDAYAARYEVQTSADGVTWHTAATVRDGKGGTESVRLDDAAAPWAGARFLRIHGVQRATKYSYSLFGVEAYAVLP
ncbi:beta-N-acetylglucosaminidase domain-containing protein [Streptomyces sp. H39-S7]|uniref:beta-N-acetylglucosaminidase domain-containing protein n=1 Tax=Streptomyces sp. H39-S7 TaxID=3004357 RepID=UPI0022B00FD0|nr:beta-N-acetylglucosaminidase domain-containing protein [Streptomyces sp. H39-S7]MCZ4125604.1 beta-N-acetylglucosaminidase domain-containing protein [Streptomyces sp. H39-S7]